ncbi:hypothetical protein BWI17_18485 [Betaproteobacteria bacterium GR16-43]|nr:hypothetical protein BWI17_18485 [Betaproteobacteria bacterium GR16-43]
MKKFLAVALLAFATVASATTITRDHSDQWWVPTESGWGANVVQQGDTLFLTIFVYGADSQPTWFVGSNVAHQGNNVFSGVLYRTTGPFYQAGTFDPTAVAAPAVGTVTFNASAPSGTAVLTYVVNGQTVTKNVVRQQFKLETIAGTYVGGAIGAYAGCGAGSGPYDQPATYTITQTVSSVTIGEFGAGYTCTYTGTYTQAGRLGKINGTGTCTGVTQGDTQTFQASDVMVTPEGLTAKLLSGNGSCLFTGRFGGVRRQ